MAKVPAQKIDSTFQKIAESDLTGTQIKVFSAWFKDSTTFSACPRILAERTGLAQSAVRRAIKELIAKGVLIPSGMITASSGQRVQAYDYGDITSKLRVQNIIERSDTDELEEGASMCPIYTNIHSNTNSKSKGLVKNYKFKEEDITVDLDDL